MNAALLRRTTATLRPIAGYAAGLEARWLIEAASENESIVIELVARRLAGEPVDRIIGRTGFWTLDLRITADTLSPRPDTETVVRAAIQHIQMKNLNIDRLHILDLGTGTGAILLALLAEFPQAHGLGIDISDASLEVAAINAEFADLEQQCEFRQGDWAAGLAGPFDVIVSNPPYIPSGIIPTLDREVREHDPHLALDGGADGLACYRAILPQLPGLLAPDGFAVLEIGFGQAADVAGLAEATGLTVLETLPDFGGVPRAIVLAKA
jgi:release factor glutamine methyltransferase